ncbi:DUF1523 family protein [Rhodobacteraceae bacterium NNCM2]|nr:DUF1523 family protein [Coraliihabitans acroporae]
MAKLRWGIGIVLFAAMAIFLQYYLPDRDIVQIVGTEVVRLDAKAKDGTVTTTDQPRINARWPDGSPSVYRNDDTGWGWPPYFKFDSADLQAEAQSYANDQGADKKWVVVRHYGWRIPWLSQFPNALSMRDASGPDESLVPWFNIVLVALLLLTVLVIRRILILLFDRHVAPVIDDIDAEFDETSDRISDRYRGFRGWLRRLFGG